MSRVATQQNRKKVLSQVKRVVIKIGSALITRNGQGVDDAVIAPWVQQIAKLREHNIEVLLVSSGAVAEGMAGLGWQQRPNALHDLQAAAALGQMALIQRYQKAFNTYQIKTAQVLLTHADLSNRQRYLNARSTLQSLLAYNILPVVNENDAVATDEIRFGDNDSLAAMVANLIEADLFLILTDQKGLFDKDPRNNADAKLIEFTDAENAELEKMATGGKGALGSGGMLTKVRAAKTAARSGTHTVIASGADPLSIINATNGENVGTFLYAKQESVAARKQWLAGQLKPAGSLVLDAGAVKVLQQSGKSLLPVGVIEVRGQFTRGDLVQCLDQQGNEVARGLVNYSAEESRLIQQQASSNIEKLLGYIDAEEIIHRDNLVLTD